MVIKPAKVSFELPKDIKDVVVETYKGDRHIVEDGEVFLDISEWIGVVDSIKKDANYLNEVASTLQKEINLAVDKIRELRP